jgi:hypothetical protein
MRAPIEEDEEDAGEEVDEEELAAQAQRQRTADAKAAAERVYKQREEIAQRNAAAAARSEAEVARIEAEHRIQEALALEKIRLDQEQERATAPAIPSRGNQDSILAQQEAEIAAKRAAAAKVPVPAPGSPAASVGTPSSVEEKPPPSAGLLSIRAPGSGSATLDQAADLQSATAKLQAIRAASAVNGAPKSPRNSQSPQYGTAFQSKGFTPAQAMAQAFQPGSTFRNLRGGRRKTRRRRRTYREPKGLFAF